jgi:two-component system NtrC family response regulator
MKQESAILVIDDEQSLRRLLEKELRAPSRTIYTAEDGAHALKIIKDQWLDVVIMDLKLPDVSGLELLEKVREMVPDAEVIMITGHGDVDTAVEAIKTGACDFIEKPFNLEHLDLVVEKARQRASLARENRLLRMNNRNTGKPPLFIGNSQAMQNIRFLVEKVAPTSAPVLITGESGSGKDVVARLIHSLSPAGSQSMVIKNCAALDRDLARSELFGHARGAFTGASEASEGLMSFAHNNTLFLDEVGDLSLEIQASLLRVLEDGSYRRVGEKQERRVNIRLLFATNRNLAKAVEEGRFNEAFYHRINVFNIEVPPLAERKEDLTLLVEYFLTRLSPRGQHYTITSKAMSDIFRYSWPGNVRELRNVLERAIILAENNLITENCLPRELVSSPGGENRLSLAAVEREHILKILDFCGGNRQQTADILGIGRKTLYRKLSGYDVSK